MAVTGRQKAKWRFSSHAMTKESASAAVSCDIARASSQAPPGKGRSATSIAARWTKPRCDDW
jgi:hypothetical protein